MSNKTLKIIIICLTLYAISRDIVQCTNDTNKEKEEKIRLYNYNFEPTNLKYLKYEITISNRQYFTDSISYGTNSNLYIYQWSASKNRHSNRLKSSVIQASQGKYILCETKQD